MKRGPSTTETVTAHITETLAAPMPGKSTITEIHSGVSTTVLETAQVTETVGATIVTPPIVETFAPPAVAPSTFVAAPPTFVAVPPVAAPSTFALQPTTAQTSFLPSATPVQQQNGTSPPIAFVGSASHNSMNLFAVSVAGIAGFAWLLL